MIRSELVIRIAEQNPHLYARDVEAVVDAILDRVADALASGHRVELRDFGTFCVRDREPRASRSPRTGDRIVVSARVHVHFTSDKGMEARLNRRPPDPGPGQEVQRLLRVS
ncbi:MULTISPECIES: HU family DNA-binding protein [unclassified Methylobacterium]|uniref:HU family DNA-binding protein n=1 Tax=unclassified Methylobacterium TaxID=2615210 RepID=UPI002269A8CD|nr:MULTISPECIES: HU family DNA-binding protein [unclassified Methylobacterium]